MEASATPDAVASKELQKAALRQKRRDDREKKYRLTVRAFWAEINRFNRKSRQVPDQPFRLMSLPPELRHIIFQELLIMPGPIRIGEEVFIEGTNVLTDFQPFAKIDSVKVKPCKRHPDSTVIKPTSVIQQSALLGIFRASKTLYCETMPIYYHRNVFQFANLTCFEHFAMQIGVDARWQLTKLNLVYIGRAPAQAVKQLMQCPGLKEIFITIEGFCLQSSGLNGTPKQMLRGMGDLLRIRGLDKVQVVPGLFHARSLYLQAAAANFSEQLQVLLQPHDPRMLKRMVKRDFPAADQRKVLHDFGID